MAPRKGRSDDVLRYQQATNDILQQLDFCIGYLVSIRKGALAARLSRNRAYIRSGLLGEDSQPLPTGEKAPDPSDERSSDRDRPEVERYKQAANDALQQLDFCIGYLVGSRKSPIAGRLVRNRAHIRERLMGEAAEPLPTADG